MRIELAANIGRRFHTSLREAGEREIGGMLLAEQLKPGHFCIIDFLLIRSPVHIRDFGAIRRPTRTRWMNSSDARAEISNVLIILANGTPTHLFQFTPARKISIP